MSCLIYSLSLPDATPYAKTDAPRRFVKDVIRAGRFFVPHMGIWLDMDTQRIDDLVTQFGRMRANGVNVPLTIDHATTADAVRGDVTRLFRQDDRLMMECQVTDDDSEALLSRCPHVSLELEKNVTDGHGAKYPEAVTAVTITPKPVVPDQEPFQKIAASRDSGKGEITILHLSAIEDPKSKIDDKARRGKNMITLSAVAATALMTALGLSGIPDEQVQDKLVERVTALSNKSKTADTKVTELGQELATVKASLVEASKANAPAIDPDALDMAADAKKTRLSRLVEKAHLTPAASAKLEKALLGEVGKRNAVCLSRKAAAHAGFSGPLADAILDALEDNDPVALSKTLSEKSGPQVINLSRSTPDGDTAPDKDSVSNMETAAFGAKK